MEVKVIKAEVEPDFKSKVQERAKQEGRSERYVILKAVKQYLSTPIAARKF